MTFIYLVDVGPAEVVRLFGRLPPRQERSIRRGRVVGGGSTQFTLLAILSSKVGDKRRRGSPHHIPLRKGITDTENSTGDCG